MALTPKQNAFVAAYLLEPNATAAALKAGYSPETAHSQGSRLLNNVEVARCLREAQERRAARLEVTQDDVLRELVRVGQADIGKAYDAQGNLLPIHEIPEDVRRAMAGVEVTTLTGGTGIVTKVKWVDKAKALELIGKHLKMFVERHEHSIDESLESLILKARGKKK